MKRSEDLKDKTPQSMTFFRSYADAAKIITDPVSRCAFYDAVIHFGLDGEEPQNLPEMAEMGFCMARPYLEKSSNNRRWGNKNATRTERESNANETRGERESNANETPLEHKSNANETRGEREYIHEIEIRNRNRKRNTKEKAASADAESCFPFSEFWDLYGKKTGRSKCETVYAKLTEPVRQTIKEKLPAYIQKTPNLDFRKDPLTWLHGKHWEDELPTPPVAIQVDTYEQIRQRQERHL